MAKQTFIVRYPPRYDGELHIHTKTVPDSIGAVVTITIQVRVNPGETTIQAIRRVGADMQRAQ